MSKDADEAGEAGAGVPPQVPEVHGAPFALTTRHPRAALLDHLQAQAAVSGVRLHLSCTRSLLAHYVDGWVTGTRCDVEHFRDAVGRLSPAGGAVGRRLPAPLPAAIPRAA